MEIEDTVKAARPVGRALFCEPEGARRLLSVPRGSCTSNSKSASLENADKAGECEAGEECGGEAKAGPRAARSALVKAMQRRTFQCASAVFRRAQPGRRLCACQKMLERCWRKMQRARSPAALREDRCRYETVNKQHVSFKGRPPKQANAHVAADSIRRNLPSFHNYI